jgi:uncharacterized membrane protein YccC
MNPARRLPTYLLNGVGVALGIGLIQLAIGALAGPLAGSLALAGAVCASLADVPNTVPRTLSRVPVAALLGFAAALVVALLKPHPALLGAAVALITFGAMMTMAWGPRAGAVSFAPLLAMVFTMAVPATEIRPVALAGWHAAGGAAYVAWSLLSGALLQRRYRTLVLHDALRATAALIQARSGLLRAANAGTDRPAAAQSWIDGEAALAEKLQNARDFVFAAPDSARARRDSAILLRAIDLRDLLLASRLDLDRLGSDDAGRWVLRQIAQVLQSVGERLDATAAALRDAGAPVPAPVLADPFAAAPLGADDERSRLLPAFRNRLHRLDEGVARIDALLRGAPAELPLSHSELQRFVAPEGWPPSALRAQWSWRSPVLRHAVRAALALSCAYFIAFALPWTSHPHWLVLSVAVVLRGTLEQTLSRRNGRVLGTLLGCVVVLGLSGLHSPAALGLVFLGAVGVAHAFVLRRYWLTAAAATVMALLQSHLVDPAGGFAIMERVADTFIGAALAWGFSYVLPSWERRSLPATLRRVLGALAEYAVHALALRPGDSVEQRLARRRAYDALAALAGALQRSGAEPKAAHLPRAEMARVLDQGQRLMAHLSVVRLILSLRSVELPAPTTAEALAEAQQTLAGQLALRGATDGCDAAPADDDTDLSLLPVETPAAQILPWLLLRLNALAGDGMRIRRAAAAALAQLKAP